MSLPFSRGTFSRYNDGSEPSSGGTELSELFPRIEGVRLVRGKDLGEDGAAAQYEVKALGRLRCVAVRADGPVPNRVLFDAPHNGHCRPFDR